MERNTYLCWKSQLEDIPDIHDLEAWISTFQSQPKTKLPDAKENLAFDLCKKLTN